MTSVYHFLFSPEGAGWGYPFLGWPGTTAIVMALVMIAVLVAAVKIGLSRIDSREREVLAAIVVIGFFAQLVLRSLGPATPAAVITSEGSNGFLTVAERYGPVEFLSNFHALSHQLPMHVQANLPGKTLVYHALLGVTRSPEDMALLILWVSTLGAILAYFLALQWFGDRRIAFSAAVLYVLMPARIYFLPVMNVLTPVIALIPLCLLEVYFVQRRAWSLLAAGVAIYALVIFEPLPLALTPIALGQILRRSRTGESGQRDILRIVAYPIVALIAMHLVMQAAFGFNTVRAFMDALEGARAFNTATARPYGVWVFHNLKDFFLHMGIAQSILFFAALVQVSGTDRWIVWSFAFIVVVLDLLGVNRGETVRLWIFLGVILQIIAARQSSGRFAVVATVVALSILQTALLMPSVGWIEVAR